MKLIKSLFIVEVHFKSYIDSWKQLIQMEIENPKW